MPLIDDLEDHTDAHASDDDDDDDDNDDDANDDDIHE